MIKEDGPCNLPVCDLMVLTKKTYLGVKCVDVFLFPPQHAPDFVQRGVWLKKNEGLILK